MLGPMGKRDTELETDAELWARVARSAKPIAKGRIAAAVEPPKPRAKPPAKEPAPPPAKPAPKPVVKAAPTARGEALNRQTARQLERGKLPVEARLDLHGMRQREAHAALRRFLKSAQGKGSSPRAGHHRQGRRRRYDQALLRVGRARRAAPGRAALADRARPRPCGAELFGGAAPDSAAKARSMCDCGRLDPPPEKARQIARPYRINFDRSAFLARSPICFST